MPAGSFELAHHGRHDERFIWSGLNRLRQWLDDDVASDLGSPPSTAGGFHCRPCRGFQLVETCPKKGGQP